jgi:hypothetical protein
MASGKPLSQPVDDGDENVLYAPGLQLIHDALPFLFQAIEIASEHYWDGGYMGNPAIFPLIYNCDSRDVVIVHINPIERPDVPKTAGEILNRINEISFNSSLMREMRSVSFVSKLIEEKNILGRTMKHMLIHSIEGDDVMRAMNVRSKFNGRLGAGQHAYESRPRVGRPLACGSLRPVRQTVDNRYPSEVSMNGLFAPRSSRTQSVEANFPPMQ